MCFDKRRENRSRSGREESQGLSNRRITLHAVNADKVERKGQKGSLH